MLPAAGLCGERNVAKSILRVPVLRTTTQKVTIGARLNREMHSPVTNECGTRVIAFFIASIICTINNQNIEFNNELQGN